MVYDVDQHLVNSKKLDREQVKFFEDFEYFRGLRFGIGVGEEKIEGFSKETLAAGITDHGHNNVSVVNNKNEICHKINNIAEANDVVIFLDAGNITKLSDNIISEINNLESSRE